MAIYIRAAQSISPHDTFPGKGIPKEITGYNSYLKCILPDFKSYFQALERRRMSRLIKLGTACAIEAINEAGIKSPDAIISGTGLGCIEDTEKFLHNILKSDEGLLPPTAFVQSTHNSIGALMAIKYNCTGHNLLFAHRTISFENALLNAILLIQGEEAKTILVGGFDEITEENYLLKKQIGQFKQNNCSNADLLKSTSPGSIPGEGAAYFIISATPSDTDYATLAGCEFIYRLHKSATPQEWIIRMLRKYRLLPADIDMVLTGINGDQKSDEIYSQVLDNAFQASTQAYYKHLCGEYDTATAFGMWFASKAMLGNYIPPHAILRNRNREIRNVLLYNQDNNKNHSLILLSRK